MKSHFSEDEIKNYHARKLTPSELLQIDEHMEECADCSTRLLQNSTVDSRVASLDHHLQEESEEDHLEYEQLIGYLKHTLDPSDREIVEAHLQSCAYCLAEEQDLRSFGKVITGRRKRSAFILQVAGVAATLAVLLIAARVLLMKPDAEPVAFMIHDGQNQIAFNKENRVLDSKWNIPEDKQRQLQLALEGKTVPMPEPINELRSKKGVLLSEDVPDAQLHVVQPLGTVISTDRPTFRWKGPPEASGYTVFIYDTKFDLAAQSPMIDQKEWTTGSALERGKVYIWMVAARLGDRTVKAPIPPLPEARFRVLSSGDYETLKTRIQQSHGSHLLLGLHYLEFGLLDDVEGEWKQLARQNPDSPRVQSLLHSLESLRDR